LSCGDDEKTNNPLPDVGITIPADNSTFTSGTDIKIQAFVKSENDKVSRVDFYEGSNKIGVSLVSPYEFTWTKVAAGKYSLSVTAVNEDDVEIGSASISITVVDPM